MGQNMNLRNLQGAGITNDFSPFNGAGTNFSTPIMGFGGSPQFNLSQGYSPKSTNPLSPNSSTPTMGFGGSDKFNLSQGYLPSPSAGLMSALGGK